MASLHVLCGASGVRIASGETAATGMVLYRCEWRARWLMVDGIGSAEEDPSIDGQGPRGIGKDGVEIDLMDLRMRLSQGGKL